MNAATSSPSVVGVGTAVVDYIGAVADFPQPDQQIELEHFSKQAGGNVATALATLAKLGEPTEFLGKFGDDDLGSMVRARMAAQGVGLRASRTDVGGSMGFAFIVVEVTTGRRTILWTREGKSHLAPEELDRDIILSSRYLHLDHYSMEAAIAAARIAREGEVQIVLDAESRQPGIDVLLPMVDILICCADFARDYTGENDCSLALNALGEKLSAHTLVITAGEDGSYCRTRDQTLHQPAFPVDVVDTTGCGDVYHGAFIFGLLRDWPLARIAEFASAAAALNCRAFGGQAGIPTQAEIEALISAARSA